MIKQLTVKKTEVCSEDTEIVKISQQLKEKSLRHVFVVDKNQKPVGVLSTVDICYKAIAENKDASSMTAKELMTSPVQYVDINDPAEVALYIMMRKNTFSCPVVENGSIKGVVNYDEVYHTVKAKVSKWD